MKFFTTEEIRDLVITMLALALIFSFPNLQELFLTSLMVVILSFFLHEMGHKFIAMKLGCIATYKLWPVGVALGLFSILLKVVGGGIVFFALGFVEILPYTFGRWGLKLVQLTPKDLGMISLAGVGINIFLAIFFNFFSHPSFQILSNINALLALFNLIPFPPLDGSKIFLWNMWLWVFLVFVTLLSFLSF